MRLVVLSCLGLQSRSIPLIHGKKCSLFICPRKNFHSKPSIRVHLYFRQRLQCPRRRNPTEASLGQVPHPPGVMPHALLPPRRRRGVLRLARHLDWFPCQHAGERVLSVLAWGTWYFRSKALVSSGDRIARRNRCVVFSLPRSLGGLEGVKFQAPASWEKVRLGGLRWRVADWVPERCGWRGSLPSFGRGFVSKEGCVGSFLDPSGGEKSLLGWPKTRG